MADIAYAPKCGIAGTDLDTDWQAPKSRAPLEGFAVGRACQDHGATVKVTPERPREMADKARSSSVPQGLLL